MRFLGTINKNNHLAKRRIHYNVIAGSMTWRREGDLNEQMLLILLGQTNKNS